MEVGTEITVAIIAGLFSLVGIWLAGKLKTPSPDTNESQDGSLGRPSEPSSYTPILPSAKSAKSAKFAATVSFFFPGVGELYLGQSKKGLVIFMLALILGGGTMGVIWFILGVYSCFHAHKIGCLLARGIAITDWE